MDVQHPVESGHVLIQARPRLVADARVVDQYVDAAVARQHRVDRSGHALRRRHVAIDAAVRCAEFAGAAGRRAGLHVEQCDVLYIGH